MDIIEQVKVLQTEKETLENKFSKCKADFKSYITNKTIPLLERWDFYLNAPSELKEKSDWLIRPKSDFLYYVRYHWLDAEYGRGKRIYIDQLFEDFIYKGKVDSESVLKIYSEQQIYLGLEELLDMNLEYFTMDW